MTAQTRTVNAGRFENGDSTSGSNFADLMDSFAALVDTTAQSFASQISTPTLVATEVSAANVKGSAATVQALTVTEVVSASAAVVQLLTVVSALTITKVETTIAAAAGAIAASPVPLTALGYIVATVSGVSVRIPFYKAS